MSLPHPTRWLQHLVTSVALSSPVQYADAASLISHASREPILEAYGRLAKRYERYQRWLTTRHPYRQIIRNVPSGPIDSPAMAEYIGASIPLHLADGWAFLSRAFEAIVRGDRATSIHLAYYAELRAGMSLLAGQGVGVFGNRHVAVGSPNTGGTWSGPGTHDAVRELLEAWSATAGSADQVLGSLYSQGRSLAESIDEVRGQVTGASSSLPVRQGIARSWLTAWSIDLRSLREDRTLRNQVSYRPWDISVPQPQQIQASEEILFSIREAWQNLEPDGFEGARIDRDLLDRGLRMAGLRTTPETPPTNFVLKSAEDTTSGINHASPILSRAMLLLRLATASCAQTLRDSAVSTASFRFWWQDIGRRFGLWDESTSHETLADLWADVSLALDEIEASISDPSTFTTAESLQEVAPRPVATQFIRAPLWLLPLEL